MRADCDGSVLVSRDRGSDQQAQQERADQQRRDDQTLVNLHDSLPILGQDARVRSPPDSFAVTNTRPGHTAWHSTVVRRRERCGVRSEKFLRGRRRLIRYHIMRGQSHDGRAVDGPSNEPKGVVLDTTGPPAVRRV